MLENEDAAPAAEAQQDVKVSDAKAEATSTANVSDELSGDDLEAVAGGITRDGQGGLILDPAKN
jgi:hypothetical protein